MAGGAGGRRFNSGLRAVLPFGFPQRVLSSRTGNGPSVPLMSSDVPQGPRRTSRTHVERSAASPCVGSPPSTPHPSPDESK